MNLVEEEIVKYRNGKINRFEDIVAWQKARKVYSILFKSFKANRDFSFKDQLLRAQLSIMNNIAEGFERRSRKEWVQYLYIAKGSCSEVRSMLYIALDNAYLTKNEFEAIKKEVEGISKMLQGLIKMTKENYNI